MHCALKVVLIIIIVILLLVLALALLIRLPRYYRLKERHAVKHYDRVYSELPTFQDRHGKFGSHRYVITMSTIPDRIDLIGPTLASLFDQSIKVDEIVINVPLISRKGLTYQIPKWLAKLKHVTIHRVDKDEGPGTKLLPTLRREKPQTRIIVVDDDNIYHPKMIENIIYNFESRKCHTEQIALTNYGFHFCHDGSLPPLKERLRAIGAAAEDVDLLQGFSGFIVVPEFFPKAAYEIKDCPKECISVDDIWFTGWLHKNGVRVQSTGSIWSCLPIINFGKMRQTTCLAHGENKDFVTDQIVINWFMKEHGYKPVLARNNKD